jgi:hypothetical protein
MLYNHDFFERGEQESTLWATLVPVITSAALNTLHNWSTSVQFMQLTTLCNKATLVV